MKSQLSRQKIATLIALLALLLSSVSCSKISGPKQPDNVDYYTCTVHPSVKSQDPNGKRHICSMDLVPVMKKGGADEKASASSPKPHGLKAMRAMQAPAMPIMKRDP